MRQDVSNAMVGLMKEFYGKGPTDAKTYINDNYIFCVMKGGLTRNEETLLDKGEAELVRTYRLRFQEAMAGPMTESSSGSRVVGSWPTTARSCSTPSTRSSSSSWISRPKAAALSVSPGRLRRKEVRLAGAG